MGDSGIHEAYYNGSFLEPIGMTLERTPNNEEYRVEPDTSLTVVEMKHWPSHNTPAWSAKYDGITVAQSLWKWPNMIGLT